MHAQPQQKQQFDGQPLIDTQSYPIVTSLGIFSNSTLQKLPKQNQNIQATTQYLCCEYDQVCSPKIGYHQYNQKVSTNECRYGRQSNLSKDHDGDQDNVINSVKSIEERIRQIKNSESRAGKIGQECQKQNQSQYGDISVENAEDPNYSRKDKKVDGSKIQSENSITKGELIGRTGKNVDGGEVEEGSRIRPWQREYNILHKKLRSSLKQEQAQIKQMLRLLKQIQIANSLKDTKCQISQIQNQIRKIKLHLADGFKEPSLVRGAIKPQKCDKKRVQQLRHQIQNQKKLSNYLSIHELELEEIENKLKYSTAKVKQQQEHREQQGWISEQASQQSSKTTIIEVEQAALATTQIDPNIVNKICESKLYIKDNIKLTDNSQNSSKFLLIKDSATCREYDNHHDRRHGHYDSDYAYHFANTNANVDTNNSNNNKNIASNMQADSNGNRIGQNEGGSQFSSISEILNSSAFAVKNVVYQSLTQPANQLSQKSGSIKQFQAQDVKKDLNSQLYKEYYKLLEQRKVILQRSITQSKEEQKKKEELLKQQRMSIKKSIQYFKLQAFLLQSQNRRLCYTQLRHNHSKRQHPINSLSFNSSRYIQKKNRQKSESRKIRIYKIKTDYSSHQKQNQNQNSNQKQHSYQCKMAVHQYQFGNEGIQTRNQAVGGYSRNFNQFGCGSEVGRKCGVRSFKFRSSFKSNKGSRDSSPQDFIPDSEQSNIYGFKSSRAQKEHTLVVSKIKKQIKYPSTLNKNSDSHSKTQKRLQKSKEWKQRQHQARNKERCSTRHEQKIESSCRQRYGNPSKILGNSQYIWRSGSSILNNGSADGNQGLKGVRYKDGSRSKEGQLGRFRQEYYGIPQ